ncbi:MAG: hypothetical protein KKA90_02435 [Nanoarchaeota archaeon]|nr:hypothetical protein [Nanoarchaeota archaeon]
MQREVIHDYERRLEWQYRQIRKAGIPEENKEVLIAFDRFLVAEGLSLPRRAKLLQHCLMFNRSFMPGLFREASTDSIWDAVIKLESSKLAPWTKQGYTSGQSSGSLSPASGGDRSDDDSLDSAP